MRVNSIWASPVFKANKMSQTQAQYFQNRFKNAKEADIVCHELTDRDAINSAIAVQRYLDTKGIQSRIIISQNLQKIGIKQPDFNYIQADEINPDDTPPDTVICVDFSAKERVSPNVLAYMQKSPNLLCIDHHQGINLFSEDYLVLKEPIYNADEVIHSAVPCYVDSSAKSATSIIYRFFEAIGEEVTKEQAYSLMFGFVDDSAKRGYVICNGKEGTLEATNKLKADKNAYEIYQKLYEKLDEDQISRISRAVDIMSDLTELEQKFYGSLYSRLKFSPNGKIAYVEIPPDDLEWKELGADNSRTSTILNRFRQKVIKNEFNDEKLNDIELVAVFYEADGKYRISAHTKRPTLLNFYKYIEQWGQIAQMEELSSMLSHTKPDPKYMRGIFEFTKNAGGHPDRGGGKIFSTDPKKCHEWVEKIIDCADFYDNKQASYQILNQQGLPKFRQ